MHSTSVLWPEMLCDLLGGTGANDWQKSIVSTKGIVVWRVQMLGWRGALEAMWPRWDTGPKPEQQFTRFSFVQ
jgi:hypothetical protein